METYRKARGRVGFAARGFFELGKIRAKRAKEAFDSFLAALVSEPDVDEQLKGDIEDYRNES